MKYTVLALLITFTLALRAESIVDVNNKVLKKEIRKYFPDYQYTLDEISLPDNVSVAGKYFYVNSPKTNPDLKYIYMGRVFTVRGTSKNDHSPDNSSEFFDYFILFDTQQVIKSVRIYRYQATHGEGVSASGWLRQFVGYSAQKRLEVGRDVDAISGATLSVNNITADIQSKTRILQEITR